MTPTPEKVPVTSELTPEIKTPEELITRLEAKSEKNLATRVRNIKKTVTGGTELDWKQLQSELSPAEKQKIEDVLKAEDPEVGNRLKIVAEVTTGVVVAWWAAAITTKEKKENTNKMKEWFKEGKEKRVFLKESMLAAAKKSGGELDLGEKIMINIMAFMAPLIPEGMLGWLADFGILPEGMADGLKEWENGVRVFKDKVEWVKGKVEEKVPEVKEEIKNGDTPENRYLVASIWLTEVSEKTAQEWWLSKIFPLKNIQDLRYRDIQRYTWDPQWFRTFAWLKDDIDDVAIWTFLSMFTESTDPFYKILSSSYEKKFPWKTLWDATIMEVISSVWLDINFLKIIKSINVADYENSIAEATKSLFVHNEKTWEISWDLIEKAKRLWFSKNLITVLFSNRHVKFNNKDDLKSIYDNPNLTKEDKEILGKFGLFGEWFKKTLFEDQRLNLWNGSIMEEYADINVESIMKSYILTWGESNLDKMTSIEKIGAYTAFFMISANNPDTAWGVTGSIFNVENIEKLTKKWLTVFDEIPEDAQQMVRRMFSFDLIWPKIKGYVSGSAAYVENFAKKSPGFSAILILIFIFGPIFSPGKSLMSMIKKK